MKPERLSGWNRPFVIAVFKTTFTVVRNLLGTCLILGLLVSVVSDINPMDGVGDGLKFALAAFAPMTVWTVAAILAGGTFAGLSLTPREIWKPVLLCIPGAGLLALLMLGMSEASPWMVMMGSPWVEVMTSMVMAAIFSSIVAFFVAAGQPYSIKLQRWLLTIGALGLGSLWLAMSLMVPIAMREQIPTLTQGAPYRLLVPSRREKRSYRELTNGPDFWTFQVLLASPVGDDLDRMYRMLLIIEHDDGTIVAYNWSFRSGFRFHITSRWVPLSF